jgi:hypothetical protein
MLAEGRERRGLPEGGAGSGEPPVKGASPGGLRGTVGSAHGFIRSRTFGSTAGSSWSLGATLARWRQMKVPGGAERCPGTSGPLGTCPVRGSSGYGLARLVSSSKRTCCYKYIKVYLIMLRRSAKSGMVGPKGDRYAAFCRPPPNRRRSHGRHARDCSVPYHAAP